MITIVSGMPGVGKSYETEQQLNLYIQPDASVNRPGRKVLIFDTNDEYRNYKSVMYNVKDPKDNGRHLQGLKNVEIRRVLPYYPSPQGGTPSPMGFGDKEKTLIDITNNYRDGLVLLEDINTYLVAFKSADTISLLCAARHKGIDLIIQVQSLSAIDTRMFQNSTYIRMHYQTDDITRYKGRLNENFEPLKIAQNIINKEYIDGNIRFFLYYNNRTKKITGASKEQYDAGLELYKMKNKSEGMLSDNPYMYFEG